MKYLKILLFASFICFSSSCKSQSKTDNEEVKQDKKIVLAYVTSWSSIMPDPNYITHINYAFGHVNDTFNGIRIDNPGRLKQLVGLKQQYPSLKVILSIGGWGSGRFSEMAKDETTRLDFAKDCKRVVDEFQLDGIDIDWEYPTASMAGISASVDDTKNYTLMMRDIRSAIGKGALLTLATAASSEYIDFRGIDPYIDFVNIMSYDMGNPPFHHSGLYRSEHTGGISVDEAVNAHVSAGVSLNKLVLGIPFYGRGGEKAEGFINYKDVLKLTSFEKKWDDAAKSPYLIDSSGKFVCGYDDPQSIAIKCQYITDKNMLGAMYWDYDGDDSNGTLRKAVYNGLN